MRVIVVLIFGVLFITNCAKNTVTQKYYVLDFPINSNDNITENPISKDVLEILPAKITEVYASHRIAVRKRSHEITYYNYHQWAESPDQNIARLVQRRLAAANLFARVSDHIWSVAPRYQLSTYVNHIEAVEGEDSLFAHISVHMEIVDRTLNKAIVMHSFDRRIGYEDWDLNFLSQGISAILDEESAVFVDKVRSYLTDLAQSPDSDL